MHKQPIYADTFRKKRRRRNLLITLICLLLVACGSWFWLRQDGRPSKSRYPVLGVTLSQDDGFQDFSKLHQAGVDFAYLKATQGASYFDDDFIANYDRAAGSGIAIGVYHYFSFDTSAQSQLDQFTQNVGSDLGTLPVGIYLAYYGNYAQNPPAQAAGKVKAFVDLFEARYRRPVVLMGSPAVLKAMRTVSPQSGRYVVTSQKPHLAGAKFWAYSQQAKIPGISSRLHASVFLGSKTQFENDKTVR